MFLSPLLQRFVDSIEEKDFIDLISRKMEPN